MCSICTHVPNKALLTQRLPVTRRVQTSPAPANHLSTGSVSRKAQSESCWQEAAALHLCVEVSPNTMCLSSAPSSLLTSVPIMTSPEHCSLLFFSSTTFSSLLLLEFSFFCSGVIMGWVSHSSGVTVFLSQQRVGAEYSPNTYPNSQINFV